MAEGTKSSKSGGLNGEWHRFAPDSSGRCKVYTRHASGFSVRCMAEADHIFHIKEAADAKPGHWTDSAMGFTKTRNALRAVIEAAEAVLDLHFYYDDDPDEARRLKAAVLMGKAALEIEVPE